MAKATLMIGEMKVEIEGEPIEVQYLLNHLPVMNEQTIDPITIPVKPKLTQEIKDMFKDGFFDTPKTLREVYFGLEDRGVYYKRESVTPILCNIMNFIKLARRKNAEGLWEYYSEESD